jgi:hypothetical protein
MTADKSGQEFWETGVKYAVAIIGSSNQWLRSEPRRKSTIEAAGLTGITLLGCAIYLWFSIEPGRCTVPGNRYNGYECLGPVSAATSHAPVEWLPALVTAVVLTVIVGLWAAVMTNMAIAGLTLRLLLISMLSTAALQAIVLLLHPNASWVLSQLYPAALPILALVACSCVLALLHLRGSKSVETR